MNTFFQILHHDLDQIHSIFHINVDHYRNKTFLLKPLLQRSHQMANTGATTEIPNVAVWLNTKNQSIYVPMHWHVTSYFFAQTMARS